MLPASNATLAAIMLLVAACGVCNALVQGGLFGETAQLPPRFTQALLTGTAVSGAREGTACIDGVSLGSNRSTWSGLVVRRPAPPKLQGVA